MSRQSFARYLAKAGNESHRYDAGAQVLNVMHPAFAGGARGDGVHDDTAAIQAALTAAATSYDTAVAGAVVYLPPQSFYKVSSPLTVYNGTHVLGGGISPGTINSSVAAAHGAILKPTTNLASVFLCESSDKSSEGSQSEAILFENFTIDGHATVSGSRPLTGFTLHNFGGIEMRRVRVKHVNGPAVLAYRDSDGIGYRLFLNNCWFSDCVNGFAQTGTSSKIFLDAIATEFRTMTGYAFDASVAGVTGTWTGGFIGGSTGGAVDIEGGGVAGAWDGFSFDGVTFENVSAATGTAIKIRDGVQFSMVNCTLANTSASYAGLKGIDIGNTTGGLIAVRISPTNMDATFTGLTLASTTTGMTILPYFSGSWGGSQVKLTDNSSTGTNLIWYSGGVQTGLFLPSGLSVGGGTLYTADLRSGATSWNPGNIVSGSFDSTTVTITGARLGDIVIGASFDAVGGVPAGLTLGAHVTSNDTVTVSLFNASGSDVNLATGNVRVALRRYT